MTSKKANFEGYERIKTIGKGAFGTAVLYKRLSDNKDVVIKEIFLSEMSQPEKELAFNEAEVLSSLNHHNIIRYMGSSEKDGSLLIEMEYADNGNLAQLINLRKENNRMFKEKDILNILSQITAALSYMHSHMILHRDLKAANIFLNKSGIIKIGDFGISKIMSTRAQAQTVVGTPYYLSPEMCEGKEYDGKSDIWALGCILYELTCFRKPFEAPNLPALVHKISTCEYDDIPEIYSKDLSQLIADILQKDYTKRPSAQHLHDNRIPAFTEFSNLNTERRRDSIDSLTEIKCEAGDGFSIFLNKKGLIYTCGNGQHGCLGHGSWNSLLRPTIIDTLISVNISQICCGTKHVLALTTEGRVYSWGSSSHGQLGLGHEKFCYSPTLIKLPSKYKIVNIFAENNSSALIDDTGRILVCGDNTHNKLGVKNEAKLLKFQVLKIVRDKAMYISMGFYHSIIVTQNGKIIGIGRNNKGQLGMGNCKTYNYPQNVTAPENVRMVSCGTTFTAATTDDNIVYFWGTYYNEDSTQSSNTAEKSQQDDNLAIPNKNKLKSDKILDVGASLTDLNKLTDSIIEETIINPKSVLALHASKERINAGHNIWLDKVQALSNSLLVLIHTTAPPPSLRKANSVDSNYNSNRHSSGSANIPDWMDTQLNYSIHTTLPNVAELN